MPDNSVHAVVTDPPYAIEGSPTDRRADDLTERRMLGMQSKNWHEKATHSRGYADNDPATFQRWCTEWLTECLRVLMPGGHLVAFGGTRTWHRLAVAAEDAGFEIRDSIAWLYTSGFPKSTDVGREISKTDPAAGEAWSGWSTTLKPSHEPVVLARKPLEGTVAQNLLKYGVGALNIRGTRVGPPGSSSRWPTNVMLDTARATDLDAGSKESISLAIWVSKPNQSERVTLNETAHPTVKPLDLMRVLTRLVAPTNGLVLDPFAGSGTTAEAALIERMRSISIERELEYTKLIEHRLARRLRPTDIDDGEGDVLHLPL
ncbi:hypothetical protein ASD11_14985 [Aeromicrobium sp. Root495]|nr:hypothetical protein ASD11_14985 [Aeromicrobium sp. Root495]